MHPEPKFDSAVRCSSAARQLRPEPDERLERRLRHELLARHLAPLHSAASTAPCRTGRRCRRCRARCCGARPAGRRTRSRLLRPDPSRCRTPGRRAPPTCRARTRALALRPRQLRREVLESTATERVARVRRRHLQREPAERRLAVLPDALLPELVVLREPLVALSIGCCCERLVRRALRRRLQRRAATGEHPRARLLLALLAAELLERPVQHVERPLVILAGARRPGLQVGDAAVAALLDVAALEVVVGAEPLALLLRVLREVEQAAVRGALRVERGVVAAGRGRPVRRVGLERLLPGRRIGRDCAGRNRPAAVKRRAIRASPTPSCHRAPSSCGTAPRVASS
jgi:hypothetical protein